MKLMQLTTSYSGRAVRPCGEAHQTPRGAVDDARERLAGLKSN